MEALCIPRFARCYELNRVPPPRPRKRNIGGLNLGTCEYDLIWKESTC